MADETPLTRRSATALAAAIRDGEISARAVVDSHIAALEREQRRINAIAVERYDAARAEADAADRRLAAGGELPPLLGVPFTVKEIINVQGMPHTAGLVARRGVRAKVTAPVAQRLLDAGAILVGLTNTAELALWFETENAVYGRTANPHDPARTAGGSSGGCAAAVACGGVPFSIGTDTGGSLRVPAFCCGVFAHKPSLGLVPQTLEFPRFDGETRRMVTFGPVARSAEDLMALLRIVSGRDGSDPTVDEAPLGDPASVAIDGLRVVVAERAFVGRIGRELIEARERSARALAAAGARIERVALPEMRRMLAPALATLGDGGRATLTSVLRSGGAAPITVAGALRPGGGGHTVPVRLWAVAESGMKLAPERWSQRQVARGRDFARRLAETVGDGVLLHPPLPRVAPRHRRTYGRLLLFQPAAVFNVAALPVTQVPLGLGRGGLPLGVQVAAGPGRDHVAIAVALELARRFGGWRPPPAV